MGSLVKMMRLRKGLKELLVFFPSSLGESSMISFRSFDYSWLADVFRLSLLESEHTCPILLSFFGMNFSFHYPQ